MTNLLIVLPKFDIQPFTHIIPSLEKAQISTADLLTLDAVDVAKRAQVPPSEVKKLHAALLEGLQDTTRQDQGHDLTRQWSTITTLDDGIDAMLGGGIATQHITEFVGERYASLAVSHSRLC
jgi:DNA repair protein RAD57